MRKTFIALSSIIILIVFGFGGCYVLNKNNTQDTVQISDFKPKAPLASFIESWNEQGQKYPSQFRFIGVNADRPQQVLDIILKWCAPFTKKPSPQFQAELKLLLQDVPPTSFHAYEDFRQKHYREKAIELNPSMTSNQLAYTLNSYLGIKNKGQTPDYITKDTVQYIVYMNNFCQFFVHEKDQLHYQKIDMNIDQCHKLHTNGKYPALDALLD